MLKSWSIGILVAVLAGPALASPQRTEIDVPNPDGTLAAKVVVCNDCKDPAEGKECASGAAEGWRDGKPCGSCLLQANWGVLIEYAYDVHIAGTLVDSHGRPVSERFVKMFLPNGWSVRTRTLEDGTFRMILGATLERKASTPIVVDVGERVDSVQGEDPHYTIYFLPADYKPCSSAAPMDRAPEIDPSQL